MDNQIVAALGNTFSNTRLQLDGYSSIHHREDHSFPLCNVNLIESRRKSHDCDVCACLVLCLHLNLIAPKRTFHDCDGCACSVLGIHLWGKVGKGGSELANKLPKFFDNENQICRSLRSGPLKGDSLTGAQTCPF